MADLPIFQERAKNLLRAELKRNGLGYKELADRLSGLGVTENDRNLANKISRGSFTAAFFLACMEAIGVSELRI